MANKCSEKEIAKYRDIISGYKFVSWYDLRLMAALKDRGATIGYKAYLKTQLWAIIKDCVHNKYLGRCALCNNDHRLEVHHRQYNCLYIECRVWDTELVLLCHNCHSNYHRKAI